MSADRDQVWGYGFIFAAGVFSLLALGSGAGVLLPVAGVCVFVGMLFLRVADTTERKP